MANKSIEKFAGKKKINHYTKEICAKELNRLVTLNQQFSRYYKKVLDRSKELK